MKEVAPRLWVGSQEDFAQLDQFGTDWPILHAARDPWHRQFVGYTGRSAPEGPERLWARRHKRLALNLIDGPDAKYVTRSMIDAAMAFLDEHMADLQPGCSVMVCCNQGKSRAPTLAMLYLAPTLPEDFDKALAEFGTRIDGFAPGAGILGFARIHWRHYRNRKATAATRQPSEPDQALDKAQELWAEFAKMFQSDPTLARDTLISHIRIALQEAANGSWPRVPADVEID